MLSLDIEFFNPTSFPNSLKSLAKVFPTLSNLSICVHTHEVMDMDGLVHLSRMSLTQLDFVLSNALAGQVAASDSPLLFPNLLVLKLHSESLATISLFLSRTRLLAITNFCAFPESCPSSQDISAFLANVQTSGIGHSVRNFDCINGPTHRMSR